MMKPLGEMEMPWKLLVTCFLTVLTSGFVVSELYLKHTTEMTDGKPGLSMDDITFQFHGNRETNTLKKFVLGPMKQYFSETQDVKNLTEQDKKDIEAVVAWSMSGAKENGYWDPKLKEKDKNPACIYRVLDSHGCYDCHAPDADMKGNKKDSPLNTFTFISKFTKIDTGMDTSRLLSLSHIHLLGMGMMFLLAGAAIASTRFSARLRSALIVGGLSSILLDIFGWWGVKWYGAAISPIVFASGALMAASFTGSVFFAMWDMWIWGAKGPTGPKVPSQPPVIVDHGHA